MRADATRTALDLGALLGPQVLDRFFKSYWERRPFVVQHRSAEIYAGLPQIDDFEQLLASLTAAQSGWFSVVKVRARPPADTMLTHDGLLNLVEVFAAYRDGHSLLLNQVQRRHHATGRLCRSIEVTLADRGITLAKNIGANAYLSPSQSQGFSIHYDPHDVFVLQLAGRKAWRIFGQHVRFPTKPPSDPISPELAGEPKRELTLEPGDLMYLPRGVLHDARTLSDPSLHLTLSVELVTWRDLLAEVLAADERFGRALPVGFARGGVLGNGGREQLRALTRALATSRLVPQAASRVSIRWMQHVDPLPTGALAHIDAAASLRADTELELVHGTVARVQVQRTSATLHLPGATLRAGRELAPVLKLIARGRPFRARDLPIAVKNAEKVALVRELYAGGHLRVR